MGLENTVDQIVSAIATMPASDKRRLIAIAGPPAVGKSTLAERVCEKLNVPERKAAIVPMDGFHLDNQTLAEAGLLSRKGSPMTFDVDALSDVLVRLKTMDRVTVPQFDRVNDCTLPDALTITAADRYAIVEGNYLLLDQDNWCEISQIWDYSIFVKAHEEELERRLIDRWLHHGLDQADAKTRARENDLVNAVLVLNHRMPSDLTLFN